MFRLYCLTFEGNCRADEETRAHIHESPHSMTIPLVVLAVLTVLSGWLGMPHAWGTNLMERWLEVAFVPPAMTPQGVPLSSGAQMLLVAIAVFASLCGIGLAFSLYRRGPSAWVKRVTGVGLGAALYEVVANKFYVDEFYDLVIVKPFRWLAATLYEVVDRFIIDLVVVNGSAFAVDIVGRVVRWFQNGQVQRYLVALLAGAALLFFLASRPTVEIQWSLEQNGQVQFAAEVGGGPSASGAEVWWDFNGDGRPDSTERKVGWSFPRPGEYNVTLHYKEPIFGREREVATKVIVPVRQFGGAK
jgi:NADH-quinone oxidoreductase subunit L